MSTESYRLLADVAAFVQQVLDVAELQREPDYVITAKRTISRLDSKWRNGENFGIGAE